MPDEACRLAHAEANLENLCERFEIHAKHESEQFEEIRASLNGIHQQLENNKGFIRGIIFTVSALVTGIGLIFNYFHK